MRNNNEGEDHFNEGTARLIDARDLHEDGVAAPMVGAAYANA